VNKTGIAFVYCILNSYISEHKRAMQPILLKTQSFEKKLEVKTVKHYIKNKINK